MVEAVEQPLPRQAGSGGASKRSDGWSATRWTRPWWSRSSRLRKHRLYKHTVRVTKRFKAHDERNVCRDGDTVRIRRDTATEQGQAVACCGDYGPRYQGH